MVDVKVEERGRILIPKKFRDELDIKGGNKMKAEVKNGEIVLKPVKNVEEFKKLKGVVKDSKIDPLEAKEIWEM
jgi:AbrB family looped-hinge helix DNA binding protein